MFSNANVTQPIYQKHLGIIIDSKLTFENHINMVTAKRNNTLGIVHKLQNQEPC